jgi:integration host factor subunit beta
MGKAVIKRSNLIEKMERKHNLSAVMAESMVKAVLDKMTDALSQGRRIEIRGFGSFELRFRAPRKARNPKTGETVQTGGKHVIHFKPGKEMRDRVNSGF